MNRTLVESAKSMMAHSSLPQRFWTKAISTATYVQKRCTTKALDDKTPYEVWTGSKPSVKNLKVFRCIAYSQIPADLKKKLYPTNIKSIFVGYAFDQKAYKLFNPENQKTYTSRDVIFLEDHFHDLKERKKKS